jgi:hypothetical protein
MRKAIFCITLLIMVANAFSQQTTSPQKKTKEDYLLKSKKQKTTGWILLGGGAGLIIIGDVIGNSNEASFDDAGTGLILAGIGAISMLTSIPVFLASGKNKRRANRMTSYIRWEHERSMGMRGLRDIPYPALALRIKL